MRKSKSFSKFEFLVQAQKQICNLMKFDSYPRFIKSELYKECLLRDISGQPLPLRGKPDANLQLHQNPPLHQSLSTNVSESLLSLVQFINSIVICSMVLILDRNWSWFLLSYWMEYINLHKQRFIYRFPESICKCIPGTSCKMLNNVMTVSYLFISFVKGMSTNYVRCYGLFRPSPPPLMTTTHSTTWDHES